MTLAGVLGLLDELRAINMVLSARVSALEESNEELRLKLKLEPPPPTIGVDAFTVKQAAGKLGVSISGVHYLCRVGKLRKRKIGGKVLIDARVMQNYILRASRNAR